MIMKCVKYFWDYIYIYIWYNDDDDDGDDDDDDNDDDIWLLLFDTKIYRCLE